LKPDLKKNYIPNHTILITGKIVHPRPASNLARISVLPQFLELTGFENLIFSPSSTES